MKSYNICAFVPGLFSLSIILYILPTWKHVFCFYSFSWLSSIPLFVCPQPSLLVQSLPVGLPAGGYIVLISLRTHSVLAAFTAQAGCKLNNWRVHTALRDQKGCALPLWFSSETVCQLPLWFLFFFFLQLSVQFYAFLGDGESAVLVHSPDATELSKAGMVPREKKNTIESWATLLLWRVLC